MYICIMYLSIYVYVYLGECIQYAKGVYKLKHVYVQMNYVYVNN